ncbi:MAG TPA: polysaccharide deacetylase family protein [Terriglobales bacterium]|nr:polysaccharide deacetylase family protein [Terriglobales bacterium]
MRIASALLKRVVYPCITRTGLSRRFIGDGPAVITYHGIVPNNYQRRDPALDGALVHQDSLRAQLRLLKSHYQLISPEEFLSWREGKIELPRRSVLLTCDDGLRNVTEMLPWLESSGTRCLFFVTGASTSEKPSMLWYEELYLMMLDSSKSLNVRNFGLEPVENHDQKRGIWVQLLTHLSRYDCESRITLLDTIREQLGLEKSWKERYWDDAACRERFFVLDREGTQRLISAGMTIGAHTLSHPVLCEQTLLSANNEIALSKTMLSATFGRNVWAFAYPFGDPGSVSERELTIVQKAGYRCAFMNTAGGFGAQMQSFAFPRMHVTSDMTLAEFEAHLTGFYRLLRERFRREVTALRADNAHAGPDRRVACAS